MAPRIQSVATRFHLYQDVHRLDAMDFQKQLTDNGANTDHGLRFNKFFGRWQDNDTPELFKQLQTDETNRNGSPADPKRTEPILDWLDPRKTGDEYRIPGHEFKTLKVGNADQLEQASKRLASLADPARGATHFDLDLISRLLIGIGLPHPSENGLLFHPTLGVPYIPGTALKQVAQDWAEDEEGLESDELTHLFGSEKDRAGSIAFLDALPCEPVMLTAEQITNHYGGYYQNIKPEAPAETREDMHQPADWHEPNPVTMLAIDASFTKPLPFCFAILSLRGVKERDVEKAQNWLMQGLEIYGVGARTTVGFGRFMTKEKLEALRQKAIDEAAAEKASQEKNAREMAAAKKRIEDEARVNWVPNVGDEVIYEYAEAGERYFITGIEENGDFQIRRDGDDNNALSDQNECRPLPRGG